MIIKRPMNYTPKGKDRPLHIYLPDDYYSSTERYPVMYFFDGHNLFYDEDATYGKCWGLKDFMDRWPKKMILVGIECGHEGYERLSEYSPYIPFRRLQGEGACGDATMRWIIEEVKPLIDREYRTYPFRECTGIGGSSMGGIMSIYALVHYNNWFSKGACLSSAIGFCMPQLMGDMNRSTIDPDTRAYLSWGTGEAHGVKDVNAEDHSSYTYRNNKAVANKFLAHGALPYMYCQVGGNHCEADWEKQVPLFMDFLWMQ